MLRKMLVAVAALAMAGAARAGPGGLGGTGGSTGGPVACQVNYVQALYGTGVQNADACINGAGTNDFLNPLVVNAQAFFGFSDWVYLGKDEGDGPADGNIGLTVTGIGTLSGTWSVSTGAFANYADYMVVLKAGTEFAGFLFGNTGTTNGTWGYGAVPGLSHFTVYARGTGSGGGGGGGNPVPEPGMLGLLGLGLVGVGLARRRRS